MERMEKATFGAGCFWGVQSSFDKVEGVLRTTVGYSGGHKKDPSYEDVCTGTTGHAEVLEIDYDSSIVSYKELLDHLFSIHDPTTLNRQGPDRGSQYRSVILYHNEAQKKIASKMIEDLNSSGRFPSAIVTEVVPSGPFYRAEEYHQKYHAKHGVFGCHI